MARKEAGRKYPHVTTDAKPHNHQFCPVIETITRRAMDGQEPWGQQHWMPPVTNEATAKQVRTGFYASRYCRGVREVLGEPVSVQAGYEPDGEAFRNWVRVWPRSAAKAEIARRVEAGEPLAYNIARRRT